MSYVTNPEFRITSEIFHPWYHVPPRRYSALLKDSLPPKTLTCQNSPAPLISREIIPCLHFKNYAIFHTPMRLYRNHPNPYAPPVHIPHPTHLTPTILLSPNSLHIIVGRGGLQLILNRVGIINSTRKTILHVKICGTVVNQVFNNKCLICGILSNQ